MKMNLFLWSLFTLLSGATLAAEVIPKVENYRCSSDRRVGCSGLLPLRSKQGSQVGVLDTGEDSFAYRLKILKKAQYSIRIQALIFTGDESGLMIADVLKQKAREGKQVQVIVDGLSNPSVNSQLMYYDLLKAGVDIEGYEPLLGQVTNEVAAQVTEKDPEILNKRFHEKIFLIDAGTPAAVAVAGGLNIANEYFRVGPPPHGVWRDQDVALKGEITSDLKTVFDRNMAYFKELKEKRPELFNTDDWRRWLQAPMQWIDLSPLAFLEKQASVARANLAASRDVNPQFFSSDLRFMQSRPRFKETYIYQTYLKLIEQAQHDILIVNAYFVPDKQITAAIQRANERNVRVTILTNSPETNDMPAITYVGRFSYLKLMSNLHEQLVSSASIYEWQGFRYNEGTIHAKFAVFDNKISLVGSFNLDPRSEHLNSESAVIIDSEQVAARLRSRVFVADLLKSLKISPDDARNFMTKDVPTLFNSLYGFAIRDWM